jgi:glycerophosphoryl diester phosphodiesterase
MIPLVFGHRGASHTEPENTMRAFREAFNQGAAGIEFDIHQTADEEIVVIHDDTIDRTSNGSGVVKELTLSQLRSFDFGKKEKIPTLEEVLQEFGNSHWLNIEIKALHLERQLVQLLADYSIQEKLVVSSFLLEPLNNIKQHNSFIPTGFLFNYTIEDITALQKEVTIDALHPHYKIIDKNLVQKARKNNLAIRAWTVDALMIAQKLAALGVEAIITNKPGEIANRFKKN